MSQGMQSREPATRNQGVKVDALSHAIDGTPVLDAISLDIKQGEVLVVIGPSGTGKTTLLRLLALFEPPQKGTITIDGTDIWSLSRDDRLTKRRDISMVFQQPHLFDASVRRNIEYGAHIRKSWQNRLRSWIGRINPRVDTTTIDPALKTVELDDQVDEPVSNLSGGEEQRVAFARALAVEPDYLLLDEPTSDLDPRNTALIEEAVRTARDRGLGVAIATHDMHQAERIADRVAVMINGCIIELGPPKQVFDAPADPRARKFIDGELVY